jgi:isoquinoline 1-oxidoreductase beta subunit
MAEGNAVESLAAAEKKIEADYEAPLLAHAAMEPLAATAHVKGETCEIWAPTQHPQGAQATVSKLLGIPSQNVKVNVTFIGGGFGRKAPSDFIAEAVLLSKAVGAPVKVVYTREDDMRNCFYRQASYHKLAAGLDANNTPIAWYHRVAATPAWTSGLGGPDERVIEIAQPELPAYTIPNYLVELTPHHTNVPIGFVRSVEHSYNAFVIQSFIDELAYAAGKDPLALRLELLGDKGAMEGIDYRRWRGVLELAASKADWGHPLPKGRGRGIAAHFAYATYCAQVAEVEVASDGSIRVHRIVAAVDCGIVVNPLTAEAQVEGSIAMGLSQALKHEITFKDGRVEQGNYDTYPVLRINEMPRIEVHFVPSSELPTGIGEPSLPPTVPAVANAIFAATGRRVRKLPIRPADLARG